MRGIAAISLMALATGLASASLRLPKARGVSGEMMLNERTWDKDGNEIGPFPSSSASLPVYTITVDPGKDKDPATFSAALPDKDKYPPSSVSSVLSSTKSYFKDPASSSVPDKDKPVPSSSPYVPNKDKFTTSPVGPSKDKPRPTGSIDPGKDKSSSSLALPDKDKLSTSNLADPNKDETPSTAVAIPDKDKPKDPAASTLITVTQTGTSYVIATVVHIKTASTSLIVAYPDKDKDKDKTGLAPQNTTTGYGSPTDPVYFPSYLKDKDVSSQSTVLPYIKYYTPAPLPDPTLKPVWSPEANGNAYGGGWACVPLSYVSATHSKPSPTGTVTGYKDKDSKDKTMIVSGTTYIAYHPSDSAKNNTVAKGTLKPYKMEARSSASHLVGSLASLIVLGTLSAALLL